MLDKLRPWIARVAAVLVSGIAGWLFTKYKVTIPTDISSILTTVVETVIVMLASYVLTHIPVNKFVNPQDAASTQLAAEGVVKNDVIKEQEKYDSSTSSLRDSSQQ